MAYRLYVHTYILTTFMCARITLKCNINWAENILLILQIFLQLYIYIYMLIPSWDKIKTLSLRKYAENHILGQL